ncbi:MAG: hypothetical protein RI973_1685 [Bacteroidota bacterium]|jgi:aspartyl-tRNA(Asn)/glutamyl-tRNA(Gln) amidotransferase subunit A
MLIRLRTAIERGETSCSELVRQYLARIEETRHLNAYVEVYAEEALNRAAELDEKFKREPSAAGPLFGAVVSIKDVICHEGHEVTAGSRILQGFRSLYSATAVERLLKADAIIIGRVNCDEFAMGSTNESSFHGPARNGEDPSKVPGGSSGGSAVAVQTDTCLVSIGSDTGGSVRQPAAFCGVTGFKPTYGRISRYGLLAYASSFDQIGLIAREVSDIAAVLQVIAGPDDFDATALPEAPDIKLEPEQQAGRMRIACFDKALHHPGMNPDIRQLTLQFIEQLKGEGHVVENVEFDYLDYLIPTYYVLTTAEASSNLSRYDGIRFGYRAGDATNIRETYTKSRTAGFGTEVKRRILLGTFVLSAGYYDAYYAKAQQMRRLIRDRTRDILHQYDFILMPASPLPPWKIGEVVNDPVAMYLADIFTVQANLSGCPAIAFPIGRDGDGMPVGIQLMADLLQESKLLSFSQQFAGKC